MSYRHPDAVVRDHPNARCRCLRCYVKRHGQDHVVTMVRANCLEDQDGCWMWTKATTTRGSPVMNVGRKSTVQRILWEAMGREPIGPGDMIVQSCGKVACCRPACSRVMTRSQSIRTNMKFRRKLPDALVLQVKALRRQGRSYRQISKETGLHHGHVGLIARGEVYADVQEAS